MIFKSLKFSDRCSCTNFYLSAYKPFINMKISGYRRSFSGDYALSRAANSAGKVQIWSISVESRAQYWSFKEHKEVTW